MTSLARGEAYAILELPVGADLDAVRTSYKRLAQKWHPDKNQKSPSDSYQKFLRISMAYKRLSTDNENVAMTRAQVLDLYKNMLPKYQEDTDEESDSSNQDSCTSESDDEHVRQFSQGRNGLACEVEDGFSAQKREQIANELITEEEKKKKQQEKRRQKKKQRREKKRLEKQATSDTSTKNNKQANTQKSDKNLQLSTKTKKDKRDEIHIETEQEASSTGVDSQENHTVLPPQNMIPGDEANIDPVIFRSRQYAIQGNSMACSGQYAAAIEWFTKAIQLDASDYRFFGNRSYCYERLDQFQKALNDAQKALSLAPDWPKGHFRKGRALAGLKNYQAAEEAFAQVIKLDSKCEDARQELNKVRASQLVDMGFSLQQALAAAQQYDSLQQALDSLLAGLVSENPMLDDVYNSDDDDDDDDEESAPEISNRHVLNAASSSGSHVHSMSSDMISSKTAISQPHTLVATGSASTATSKSSKKSKQPLPPIPQHHYEQAALQIQKNKQSSPFKNTSLMDEFKMDPCNPEGLTSLWVGNVLPSVSQETLTSLFSSCGMLQSIRVLPEKYCAFVNYFSSECAGRAMKDLQGTVLNGQPLLIKFPDNPITQAANQFEKPKSAAVKSAPAPVAAIPAAVAAAGKLRGPVNGDECYFWRTTGCQFSGTCRYRHVPENKGIDRKPWQKPTK